MNDSTDSPARCVLVGDEALVQQCAEQAIDAGLAVVALATRHEGAAQWAAERCVPVLDSQGDLAAQLAPIAFDALVSAAYLRLIPDAVLAMAKVAVNFHDGPLPGYAGLNVTTWALLAAEPAHAITWHLIDAGVDTGSVVLTEPVPIEPDDTAFTLNARCYEAAVRTFPTVARAIADGTLAATPQPPGDRAVFRRHQRPAAATLVGAQHGAADTARVHRALDLGPRQAHALGALRLVLGGETLVVRECVAEDARHGSAPGTVVAAGPDALRIATVDGDLVVRALTTASGDPAPLDAVAARHGLTAGSPLPPLDDDLVSALEELDPRLSAREARHVARLREAEPGDPPFVRPAASDVAARWASAAIAVPPGTTVPAVLAAVAAWSARIAGQDAATFSVTDRPTRAQLARLEPLARPAMVRLAVSPDQTLLEVAATSDRDIAAALADGPWLADLVARHPDRRSTPAAATPWAAIELDATADEPAPGGAVVRFRLATDGSALTLDHRTDAVDAATAERAAQQVGALLTAAAVHPDTPTGRLPLQGASDTAAYDALNDTTLAHDRSLTLDAAFRRQAAATPDDAALSMGLRTLSYGELHALVDAAEAALRNAGVGRGDRVGIAVERGIDMVVGVLATLACGAAYVPLDPTYPHERLGFMVDDAGLRALVAHDALAASLGRSGVAVVRPSSWRSGNDEVRSSAPTQRDHDPSDLAYVIYTSGSTGAPKGVMLEHRNVTNFLAAMDEVVGTARGTWLAVTSLSFDISVLELLWTLTRGFHVVLKPDRARPVSTPARPVSFSLFYFAANDVTDAGGYRLLLDGARFADAHGLEAVWVPERHFHEFGGIYPNPAVAAAAVAAVTERVQIRAGSVVAPLHHPARIAEEWAFVDNLSRGRVAIAVASGWQPNDFALRPEAYAQNKTVMFDTIDTVQRLWRGESVTMAGPLGPVEVRTLPRPVQPELPIWITSAGSAETFEAAGRRGHHVLTHLLGQSVDGVGEKVRRYRDAWRVAGHAGDGHVTLMLHTFLDADRERARALARPHLKSYLRTATGLVKDMASAFPTLRDAGADADELFRRLGGDELSQLLDMATDRYLDTSGLVGDLADARATASTLAAIGVDEVACLIDFGIDADTVLASLPLVAQLRAELSSRSESPSAPAEHTDTLDETVAELVDRHACTHLQCTPSLAAMLLADPQDQAALARIEHFLVGGEALPAALAAELRDALKGRFTNMYGPTETTIWSLVHELEVVGDGPVPIGRPIANTTIAVLDRAGQALPVGVFGELHIGGEGVARGYHGRERLTAERFVVRGALGRMYATGDVARLHPGGHVEFAGRTDFQVKVRGHRIELGEIESVLDRHPDVVQSVVVAHDGAGDALLVAYVLCRGGAAPTDDELRGHVATQLPEIMVPAAVVHLDAFPLTPNRKIDRRALPAPALAAAAPVAVVVAPAGETEATVAALWTTVLRRAVGRDDNFFEIGGHSLLAVKLFRRLVDETGVAIALTDVFRYPTVRSFAAYLDRRAAGGQRGGPASAGPAPAEPAETSGADRGALRRRALTRRGS